MPDAAGPGHAMDVSVVVATHNRSQALVSCLDSIEAAALKALPHRTELFVVANACPDDTLEVAHGWAAKSRLPVQVLSEVKAGACRARNAGLKRSSGRILVITDDDCRLAEDYITTIIAAHDEDVTPTLRGGRVLLGEVTDLPLTVKTELEPETFEPPMNPRGFLLGCNFSFTRTILDSVGLFDERFGPGTPVGAAEDTDYLFRAWKHGFRVVYDPRPLIYHFHGRTEMADVHKLFARYNQSDGAFFGKHVFTSPVILRSLLWDARNAFRERFGGAPFDKELGLSYSSMLYNTFVGFARFVIDQRGRMNVPEPSRRQA